MSVIRLTGKPTLLAGLLCVATLLVYASARLLAPEPEIVLARFANELPDIVLNDLSGMPTRLDSFSNEATLVNFWATWCAPCLREIPLLKSFHDEHDAIGVVGIAVDREEPVLEYAGEMEFNYPVLVGLAESYDAMARFNNEAQVMPFSAFTAPGGAILGVHYGELHADQLANFADTIELLSTGAIDLDTARERVSAAH